MRLTTIAAPTLTPISSGPALSALTPIGGSKMVSLSRGYPEDQAGGAFRPFAGLSPWDTQELAPALRIQTKKGFEVTIEQVSEDPIAWKITPKTGVVPKAVVTKTTPAAATAPAKSGFIPLLVPLAAVGVNAVKNAQHNQHMRNEAIAADPWTPRPGVAQPMQTPEQAAGLVAPSRALRFGDTAIGLGGDGVGQMIQSPHLSDPDVIIDSDGQTRRVR